MWILEIFDLVKEMTLNCEMSGMQLLRTSCNAAMVICNQGATIQSNGHKPDLPQSFGAWHHRCSSERSGLSVHFRLLVSLAERSAGLAQTYPVESPPKPVLLPSDPCFCCITCLQECSCKSSSIGEQTSHAHQSPFPPDKA